MPHSMSLSVATAAVVHTALCRFTLCPKKRSHFYSLNNSVKNEPILIIFGILNSEET